MDGSPTGGAGAPPEPSERQREEEYARRAAGCIRRYAIHNRMTHLGTLTNRDSPKDYGEIARRVDTFLRRMAEDGWKVSLVVVPEPHPGGHGWHVHFASPCYLPVRRVRAWWPFGNIDIQGPGRGRRKGQAPRKVARYVAKYVGKVIGAEELHGCQPRPAGAHRYWKTQGHDPVPTERTFATLAELQAWLIRNYGPWERIIAFGQGDAFRPEGHWMSFRESDVRAPPGGYSAPGPSEGPGA